MDGAAMKKWYLIIDVALCENCRNCFLACKDEHVGNDWTPYAKPQPDTGQFWLKLNEFVRGTVPKVKMHYLPVLCMHCSDAPCMPSCPVDAIYRRDDGLVVVDPVKCTGCKACVDSCPYHVIYFNEDLNIAQKCSGCAHLLDGKGGAEVPKVPRCVDACPTEALKFGEEAEFKELIGKAEILKPELGTKPRVHYLKIPRKFVAGTVYDPIKKEVIIGATCTLSKNSKKLTGTTDGFGDFWFEGLEVGTYSLKIEAKGFPAKTIGSISTEKDVNLGDIALS
jgi:Fe-S-cluster-containing dehydrogenase component